MLPFQSSDFSPVSGLAGLAGSLVGSYFSTRYANKQAERLEDKMWKRDTEYNSPAAQKQRLIDAGLNPNLMYGAGASASAGSAHPLAQPRQPLNLDKGHSLSQYMSLQSQHLQNEIAKRTAANIVAQTEESKARRRQTDVNTLATERAQRLVEGSMALPSDPFYERLGAIATHKGVSALTNTTKGSKYISGLDSRPPFPNPYKVPK